MKNQRIQQGVLGVVMMSVMLFMACGGLEPEGESEQDERRALDEIIQVGLQRAVNKESIDWDALAIQVNDTYDVNGFEPAIRVFLAALGDNQSFYSRNNGTSVFSTEAGCSSSGFSFAGLPDDVGYIQQRSFIGSQVEAAFFAGDRHNRARSQDSENIKGWVVDLTTTDGGDIYAQIASLGMFYDRETLGYFSNSDEEIPYGYADGNAFLRTPADIQLALEDPYTLMNPNGKVVVVTDLPTAGAGEAAVLALRNRPNTLILGRPTCGLAAVTQSFSLTNNDVLVLATHFITDSEKEREISRIQPDEQVGNSDELMARIASYLND